MKYIIICTLTMLICFAAGYLISKLIVRPAKKPKNKIRTFLLTIIFGTVLMSATVLLYMSFYGHPGEKAQAALNGNAEVSVREIDGGYFFDGPGDSAAIVFYPGAKVECRAYAPLILKLAESGFDCFLADVPFNFAIFGANTADRFIKEYNYDSWIMAGHSMGGIVATNYAQAHSDIVDGIILLASYPTENVNNSIKLCSIYGNNDGCLDIDEYNNNKTKWPADSYEYIIDGGNHAQFGDYGFQKGDGMASVSDDDQQRITMEIIAEYFN